MKKLNGQLDGKTLKTIFEKFTQAWSEKMEAQNNVPTFHDHVLKAGVLLITDNVDTIPWDGDSEDIIRSVEPYAPREDIERFIAQMVNWYFGRYVDYDTRIKPVTENGSNGHLDFLYAAEQEKGFSMSQGRFDCLKWKDHILFKTVHDLAIYQMIIWELKPKTIIEIGSGRGGSAVWMSDLMKSYEMDCEIISFDIVPPELKYENVTFIQGDCNKIETVLNPQMLEKLPHPWLVIEDAHVNVKGVLDYFHSFLHRGDYLIIEDSSEKQQDIRQFNEENKNAYLLDTLYCDFFGKNVTCSYNSIFLKAHDVYRQMI